MSSPRKSRLGLDTFFFFTWLAPQNIIIGFWESAIKNTTYFFSFQLFFVILRYERITKKNMFIIS